jgi:nicotinamidase-related amidase
MITVENKFVYTTLEELVDAKHTALIVVDMQNDFCKPGWVFDRLGIDLSMYPPLFARLARLLNGARQASVPVIYIQMTMLAGHRCDSPAQLRFNMRLLPASQDLSEPPLYTLEGTSGHEIIPELAPLAHDIVVRKYRSSAFWGTNLDMLLRSNSIETLVVCGCTTEGCVESTARDALFNDYYVVLPEDCVASDDQLQHEASLFLMRQRFDVVNSAGILDVWRGGGRPQEPLALARGTNQAAAAVADKHRSRTQENMARWES